MRMKKVLLLCVGFILFFIAIETVSAFTLCNDVTIDVGDTHYSAVTCVTFRTITIEDTYLIVNGLNFTITGTTDRWVNFSDIAEYPLTGDPQDMMVEFEVDSNEQLTFNISGLDVDTNYTILTNGTDYTNFTSDSEGTYEWQHTGDATIELRNGGAPSPGGGTTVTCIFDAHYPAFGGEAIMQLPMPANKSWIDIDNHTMKVNVSNNVGESMNVSFYWGSNDTLIGIDTDVVNNTYANITVGFNYTRYQNYTWYVTVNSTNFDNRSDTWWFKGEAYNWDIGRNGEIDINDITGVTAHYGEEGEPHWIRADCTINGEVDINDITLVTSHYGEEY